MSLHSSWMSPEKTTCSRSSTEAGSKLAEVSKSSNGDVSQVADVTCESRQGPSLEMLQQSHANQISLLEQRIENQLERYLQLILSAVQDSRATVNSNPGMHEMKTHVVPFEMKENEIEKAMDAFEDFNNSKVSSSSSSKKAEPGAKSSKSAENAASSPAPCAQDCQEVHKTQDSVYREGNAPGNYGPVQPKPVQAGPVSVLSNATVKHHNYAVNSVDRHDHVNKHAWNFTAHFKKGSLFSYSHGSDLEILSLVAKSGIFEQTVNAVILASTIVMAFTTNYYAVHLREFDEPWLRPLDLFFTCFFCFDLLIRLLAEKKNFFTDEKSRNWNYLDTFIVISAIAEEVLASIGSKTGFSTKFIRIIRLLRLVRAFRFLRAARSMSELRVLIAGISGSVSTLIWAALLMNIFTFVFSLFLARNVTNVLVTMENQQESHTYTYLRDHFGSVLISMFTLIQSITGGTDWGPVSEVLLEVSTLSWAVYLFYCAFGICVMMNVVTSVVINKVMEDAIVEKTNELISVTSERKSHIEAVVELFKQSDLNGDGVIHKEEFHNLFHDACVEAFFKHLGLDYEAWEPDALFDMIDWDNSKSLCIDEFVFACSVLKGQAQRLDLARTEQKIDHQLQVLSTELHKVARANQFSRAGTNHLSLSQTQSLSIDVSEQKLMSRMDDLKFKLAETCQNMIEIKTCLKQEVAEQMKTLMERGKSSEGERRSMDRLQASSAEDLSVATPGACIKGPIWPCSPSHKSKGVSALKVPVPPQER